MVMGGRQLYSGLFDFAAAEVWRRRKQELGWIWKLSCRKVGKRCQDVGGVGGTDME
jgi:hypothetical protein